MRTRELELVAAVLLFPPRFAVMAVAEVLAYLVCSIATIGHDPAVPLVPWRRQLMRNVVVPCCHVVLATIGIWSVRIDGMPDPAAIPNVPVLLFASSDPSRRWGARWQVLVNTFYSVSGLRG